MDTSPAQKAISLALSGDWNGAVEINLKLIRENPQDVEALCRLARAYAELGKIAKAKDVTNKVLKIDPTNQIAIKFYTKLKSAKKSANKGSSTPLSCDSFLEEPGKTKLVQLHNLGSWDCLSNLDPGEGVKLVPYSHRVTITTDDGKYVGKLPDDTAARMKYLIKEGNKYQVLIKSIRPEYITIFIREVERGPKFGNSPSFPPEKIDYVAFTPPELVHKDVPDMGTDDTSED